MYRVPSSFDACSVSVEDIDSLLNEIEPDEKAGTSEPPNEWRPCWEGSVWFERVQEETGKVGLILLSHNIFAELLTRRYSCRSTITTKSPKKPRGRDPKSPKQLLPRPSPNAIKPKFHLIFT